MKKYDIVAKVGEYQKNGETKGRYLNVGALMEKDGKPFLLLNRTFNPAGVPNQDNRDTVLLSLYEPKNSSNDYNQDKQPQELDDSIPNF